MEGALAGLPVACSNTVLRAAALIGAMLRLVPDGRQQVSETEELAFPFRWGFCGSLFGEECWMKARDGNPGWLFSSGYDVFCAFVDEPSGDVPVEAFTEKSVKLDRAKSARTARARPPKPTRKIERCHDC